MHEFIQHVVPYSRRKSNEKEAHRGICWLVSAWQQPGLLHIDKDACYAVEAAVLRSGHLVNRTSELMLGEGKEGCYMIVYVMLRFGGALTY